MTAISMKSVVVIIFLSCFIAFSNHLANAQELAKEQVAVLGLIATDVGNIDPIGSAINTDRVITHHLFGSLVRHPIGDCASGEFQPDLATRWEVSPDKLAWTFHLRREVKWHGGWGEVTAEDVVYSLNRVKNSKASAWRGNYVNFKEIKAADRYTVQIVTAKPEPFLLTKVANYFGGFIVCKKALEKAGCFDRAMGMIQEEVVGTGPFKFLQYKAKDRIVLARNDDYWEGKPIIERLVMRCIPDDGARDIALLKGEIAGTKGLDDYKWIRHMKSQGLLLEPMGPTDLKFLFFNLKASPFDDKRVREAFAYAVSQESIVKLQGDEISGYCTSPIPSGLYGHIDAGWTKYRRDPERARKLLAEAGYPNGLTVKIFMASAAFYLDKMVVLQNELKECGIDLNMTLVDVNVYETKNIQGLNPVGIRGTRLPLATSWLRNFYHTESIIGTPKASWNYMSYSNAEVSRLIEVAETSFDEKVRLEALAKAQKIIVEDLPTIGVVETRTPCLRNAWLDLGYQPKNNFLWNYEIGLKTRILKH
jgi:peptide/nickel transport system substrate-binding protein